MKVIFLYTILSIAGVQSEVPEKNLSNLYKEYSKELNRFLPIENPNENVDNLSFSLDLSFLSGELKIISCIPQNHLIYINDIPYKIFQDSIQITLNELPVNFKSDKYLFTIYSDGMITPSCISTHYIQASDIVSEVLTTSNYPEGIGKKDFTYFSNFSVIVLILIGFISIYTFKRSSGEITDLWGIERSLSPRNRDELLLKNKPFDKLGISILVLLSLIVSFVYETAYFLNSESLINLNIISVDSFWALLLNWVILSLLAFVFISSKYILIRIFSALFSLENFKYIQHYNNLRVAIWTFSLGLVVFTSIYFIERSPDISWFVPFIYAIPVLLFIRMLILFLKLISEGRYTVFHLFSYFCATEILPFLLVFKFILD